jgi:hypothetical protein
VEDILNLSIKNDILRKNIYSIDGKLIQTINDHQKTIDFTNFTSGFYFIKIETNYGIESVKVFKK